MKKILNWINNNFSYIQIYIFICILFSLSLLPIVYFWIQTHLEHIDLIDDQLQELKEEAILKTLYSQVQQHRALFQRYLTGDKESLVKIQALDTQIHDTLQESVRASHARILSGGKETALWQKVNPLDLEQRWNELYKQIPYSSVQKSEYLHNALIDDIVIQFGYLSDRVGISYFSQIDKYVLIQTIFLRLPAIQEYLTRIGLLTELIITNPKAREDAIYRLPALIVLVNSDLNNMKLEIRMHAHSEDLEHQQIFDALVSYESLAENLIQIVNSRVLNVPKPTITLTEFEKQSHALYMTGSQLWDIGLRVLTGIFESERARIVYRLWNVVLTTLLLTGFAFFLGLALTYNGIVRLSQLTQATDNFTNGDLSVRVPNTYQDEIGRQAKAFNRMAQRLEELINNLYELLDATSALANGNLTARIQIHQHDTEFDQVALSFNKMAETFETIIGRLQQIGMMLTTSASEIASASKEQETIVVEQEATTREIAIAANEISSTAKDFATTMNEVSQTAEKASNLAFKGKDSLNNMESIMRNMVEASTKIAAKLAVLNERAGNITSVITTITKVADQTNLLSLNASIEAEKAGEYGRSFAVIAREIRRLADQTAIATLDIEKIVNEIMAAVSSSVMGVDDFTQEIRRGVEQVQTVSEQLATIIEQVQASTARFELVNQGMQAQSTGAEQINVAIAQLSQTARHTSEAIHQFHKTVQELNQAANELSILNPFTQTLAIEEPIPPKTSETEKVTIEPTSKESKREFRKTISNLNVATNKLKDLNTQLRPQHPKNEESTPPT